MARRHDALIPLSQDHRRALALAVRVHQPAPPWPVTPTPPASTPASRRAETLEFYREQLVAHFATEEEVLLPVLRAAFPPDSPQCALLDRIILEHRLLAALKEQIEAAVSDAELEKALHAFADLLESHVRAEERGLFAGFPGDVPSEEAERLITKIHARRPPDGAANCKV
jgi:hypothetical protein